jgi:hypothetical protein
MARLVRKIQAFDELFLMTTAVEGSLAALGWSCALLFLIQMMLALVLNQILFDEYLKDDTTSEAERRLVYEYFGTFTRAMLSMFELTLANFPPICRLLGERVSEWFVAFCLFHKLTVGFAVVGIINGVFMQETFKVAAMDDVNMVRQKTRQVDQHKSKMFKLFKEADKSGDGLVDYDEFQDVMGDPGIQIWLASMDMEAEDVGELFQLIDHNNDARLSPEELFAGIARLKGNARSLDINLMRRDLRKLIPPRSPPEWSPRGDDGTKVGVF